MVGECRKPDCAQGSDRIDQTAPLSRRAVRIEWCWIGRVTAFRTKHATAASLEN
jgi:hypothetical protein